MRSIFAALARHPQAQRLAARLLSLYWLPRLVALVWLTLGVVISYYGAVLLRLESSIPESLSRLILQTLPFLIAFRMVCFHFYHLYSAIWKYISLRDVVRIFLATSLASLGFALFVAVKTDFHFTNFPRSVLFMEFVLNLLYTVGSAAMMRLLREAGLVGAQMPAGEAWRENCIVAGELSFINAMLHGMDHNPAAMRSIVGVVCPEAARDPGLRISGIEALGVPEDVGRICAELGVASILVVEPFTSPGELRKLTDNCAAAGVRVRLRMIPSVDAVVGERISVSQIRNVDIEDLLGRQPVRFDRTEVADFLRGKTVMVTGAGGSIGSELARQVCKYRPARLVLFENSEPALYHIHMELHQARGVEVIPYAGDVRFREDLAEAFGRHQVNVVFHAAAYKHVPLMEMNVPAAFRTNVLGTAMVGQTASECGVQRVVMISTDKAVRPTSVMGATKRLAERALLERPSVPGTSFVAVRFGNVIGSSGSVIPLFKRQIAQGGPVTVTSKNITRYFMTIPEAVELVLQAGAIGQDRDIMVLEMGSPVNIDTVARRLIELSGYVPDADIKIEYIGLRPGEKEYEELLTDDENVVRTPYDKIWVIARNGNGDAEPLAPVSLTEIDGAVRAKDEAALRALAAQYIPENMFAEAAGSHHPHTETIHEMRRVPVIPGGAA